MKKRIRTKLLAIALLLCLAVPLCPGAPARAEEEPHRTVRVGFFELAGYHMIDESGVRSGYGYDFLQLMARYSSLRFEYVGYDQGWGDMQQMLQNGEIDLLTAVGKTPERETLYDFSDTLVGSSTAILTAKAGDDQYADGNYNGIRVGVIRGDVQGELLDRFMTERGYTYTKVYFDHANDLTAALQEGAEIDAALTDSLRWTENEWTLEQLSSAPYYAAVKKGNTALLAQVDEAIHRMDVDSAGWRTRLLNKYYSMGTGEVVAFSAEERAYLDGLNAQGKKLTVTMNPDCAPYSYFENGQPKGIVPDIFAQVATRMGVAYEVLEPVDREEYRQFCVDGSVDVILDGMDDFYTVEQNGLEVSEVYLTSPLAVVTTKSNTNEIHHLAQPTVSLLNEAYFSPMFLDKTLGEGQYATFAEAVASVQSGAADGTYMPYYSAEWLCSADVTGRLRCLVLPKYDRAFTYAVSADEDFRLLSTLNRAVMSLSEDTIDAIAMADTEYPDKGFSLLGFLYQNLFLSVGVGALFVAMVFAALYFAGKSRQAQKELRRSRRMERYIGYLCDMYYKVLEVDIDLRTRTQYMKRDGAVQIEERDDFTVFDFASIHPDDTEDCIAVFDPSAIRTLFASGETERYAESRMKMENGEYHWCGFFLKLIPKDQEHPCSAMLLIKDVDELHREREQNHEALVHALDAANTASRSKSTFLSSMSHEIRTPLNAMIGYMTIASAAIDNKEKVLHCIDSAGVSARHLLSIINDVLDLSSMESGKMKLAKERFDLKEQLSGIATAFYQQCKLKNITFAISINGLTEEWVIGDPMRVSQILMNLMSNAVKFTREGGVTLSVEQTSHSASQTYIRFVVKDTGIGMSEEYMGRLFSPFEQESAHTAQKYGGTGLGMSITLNLVNLMGGKIDVASQQGVGSTFTVTLPFGCTENRELKAAHQDLSKLRVLVVDDLDNECDYVQALLTRCGVRSESVQSGEEAIRLVARRKDMPDRFDLCIIDWNMPGFNGVETTKLIHRECDPDIPIIIATAYDVSEFQDEALAAGAAKIISKPLFQSTLLDLLVSTYGKYNVAPEDEDAIPTLTGVHVLLAEDNETNVEVAVDILDLADVTADVAHNGQEAVELFLSNGDRYDAILMDVQMPVMDGYEATRQIRASAHERAKTIPIIAITADAFAENVASALASGMNDHVAKPIETEVLFAVLKKVYKQHPAV